MLMRLQVDGVEWDEGNARKCQSHGVSIAEIEELLFGASLTLFPDPYQHEHRQRAIGRLQSGRFVFIVFTLRTTDAGHMVTPVSARFMHAKELRSYGH